METYNLNEKFIKKNMNISNLINIEELCYFNILNCNDTKDKYLVEKIEKIAMKVIKELEQSEKIPKHSNLSKSKYPFMNMRYEFYLKKHPNYIKNPIFKSFVEKEENRIIFIKKLFGYKNYPDILNQKFKEHYFNIRFMSYIHSYMYYKSIHFDKKIRKQLTKEITILDQPLKDHEESTFKDIMSDEKIIQNEINPKNIEDVLSNEKLLDAVNKLTPRQKEVLFLIYVNGYTEKEVAKKLGISQQAVSKIKRSSLNKLNKRLRGG